MPGRQSRRSVLATLAALPLTGALSACSSDGASQSGSTNNAISTGQRAPRTSPSGPLCAAASGSSVHTPLLPATLGLVSRELLMSMHPDGVLINTSRGAVIDRWAAGDGFAHPYDPKGRHSSHDPSS